MVLSNFTLYTAPIQDIISVHNLDSPVCSMQMILNYTLLYPLDQRPVLNTRQKCISEVIEWNTIRKLVCNPSKAEVIQFSSCFIKNPILSDFSTSNARVQLADRVCNLGVTLD